MDRLEHLKPRCRLRRMLSLATTFAVAFRAQALKVSHPIFIYRMKLLFAFLALTDSAFAQQNLIPNWNFSDPTPLKSYRVDFPYQDWYAKNAGYLSQTTMAGRKCAMISRRTRTASSSC